jgi:Ran GTPase-activating protein (RanGAP) involved in mRNA processing and transport
MTLSLYRSIMEALRFCKKRKDCFPLARLSLGGNQITDVGVEPLSLILRSPLHTWFHIQLIDLQENRIGDLGASYLALALTATHTLKELNLATNRIGGALRVDCSTKAGGAGCAHDDGSDDA